MTWHEFEPLRASDGHKRSSPGHWASYPSTVPLRRSSEASRFEVPMAVAAQLHGSTAAAAAAAYQRLPAFRAPPSSGRWPQNPLGGSPKLCSSISGVGMKPFGFGAKVSTKCANESTQVEELNLRSNQAEELVEADEDVSSQKRSAKIHDFCLGIPFGGLLFCMGLLGYIFSKSTVSLVLGVAPGLATLFLGTLSLKFWRSGRSSFLFILGQAAISALLAWKYSHAYLLTNRILPWGFYASLSTAMACFYAYVLLAGGNPPPKKLAAAP